MSHSPTSSVSATTSDLLQQSKTTSTFMNVEQGAQQDRSRLEGMMEAYKRSSRGFENDDEIASITQSQSPTTNEDDYEDADDFIVNRSAPHSKSSSISKEELTVSNITEDLRDTQAPAEQDAPAEYTYVPSSPAEQHSRAMTPPELVTSTEDFAFERPQMLAPRPEPSYGPELSNSPNFNRRSVISEYAGSIHEADHFIVPEEAQLPAIVKVSRNPSKNSKKASEQFATHEKKVSVVSDEYNTNSGSGESSYSGKVSQYMQQPDVDSPIQEGSPTTADNHNHKHTTSTDTFNFDVGPLNTKKEQTLQTVDKELLTTVGPAIPSRSPHRPVSAIGLKSPVDDIINHERGESRRTKSEQVTAIDSLVDEINTSMSLDGKEEEEEEEENVVKQRDVSQPRPLPPPPLPQHRVITPSSIERRSVIADNAVVDDADDGFVTEEEYDKEKEERKKKRKSSKKRLSTFKKGHFNHDTLMTLLQATEGTIIGQEFQGIGMDPQDKQLVERLVDSLSRLTADMIVDGERREESIKRLNRAIKALEGF